jgi:protein phosphatase PTC7
MKFLSSLFLLWLTAVTASVVPSADDPSIPSPDPNDDAFHFVHKTVIIPHDQKKFRGGEDAAATSDRILVVADGVGGWANKGVNPGLYSRLLSKTIVELFEERSSQDGANNDDKFLMELVHEANHHAADQHLGSATCTTVQLTGPNTLKTLNIGDSGYSIHRRRRDKDEWQVVFASIPGQKQFNFPNQIGGRYGDVVSQVADQNVHTLQPGDIVILYSDGVSDNLHPKEYHDCLDRYYLSESGTLVSHSLVADCIARQAYVLGKDKKFDSPFAQGAREVGKRYIGGKHDDITVTVAHVELKAGPSTGPSSAPSTEAQDDDPHYSESIFVYTGPVPSKDELPTMEEALKMSKTIGVGGGNDGEL